jgi:hypothetical protein
VEADHQVPELHELPTQGAYPGPGEDKMNCGRTDDRNTNPATTIASCTLCNMGLVYDDKLKRWWHTTPRGTGQCTVEEYLFQVRRGCFNAGVPK